MSRGSSSSNRTIRSPCRAGSRLNPEMRPAVAGRRALGDDLPAPDRARGHPLSGGGDRSGRRGFRFDAPARRDRQPARDAQSREGALVLSRPPGTAPLFPADRRRRAAAGAGGDGPGGHPLCPDQPDGRPAVGGKRRKQAIALGSPPSPRRLSWPHRSVGCWPIVVPTVLVAAAMFAARGGERGGRSGGSLGRHPAGMDHDLVRRGRHPAHGHRDVLPRPRLVLGLAVARANRFEGGRAALAYLRRHQRPLPRRARGLAGQGRPAAVPRAAAPNLALGPASRAHRKAAREYTGRPVAIHQIWLRDFNDRVDRCTTCHLGAADPAMTGAPEPFRFHPAPPTRPATSSASAAPPATAARGSPPTAEDAHGTARTPAHQCNRSPPSRPAAAVATSRRRCRRRRPFPVVAP